MKAPKVTNISDNIVEFEKLCASFGNLGQQLMSQAGYASAAYGIDLANAEISKLRVELEIAKYSLPGFVGGLVFNDYFAIRQIAKRISTACFSGEVDKNGRINCLNISRCVGKIDEVRFLPELGKLLIDGYDKTDLSPLTHCFKLTDLHLDGVATQMDKMAGEVTQMPKLESVLGSMPWLRMVTVAVFKSIESMNLTWASDHRELAILLVPRLLIEDISPLFNCVKLRALNIAFNPVRSLVPLEELNNLEGLNIQGTKILDLWSVCKMNGLRDLSVSHLMVDLPGFSECKEMIEGRGGKLRVL